jgi:CBS domain-containing protein
MGDESMEVNDVTRRNVATIGPDESLGSAALKMRKASMGCLVVTRAEEVVGTITGRDVAGCLSLGHTPSACLVSRHVGTPAIVAPPTMDIFDACRIMVDQGVQCLPVVDDGKLVGIVSLSDITGIVNQSVAAAAAQGADRSVAARTNETVKVGS